MILKRSSPLFLIIALGAIVILVVFMKNCPRSAVEPVTEQAGSRQKADGGNSGHSNPEDRGSNTGASGSKAGRGQEVNKEVERLRRELAITRNELDQLSRPLQKDVLSSTVNAEIRPDETLVTGGYMTADGRHEMTFLTPKLISSNGKDMVELKAQVISVGAEFAKAHGLETLATNARNTLQHAEAWKQSHAAEILAAAARSGEVKVTSSPTIITNFGNFGNPFTVSSGVRDGATYSLGGTVARSPEGNFAVQVRIERSAGDE